MYWKFGVLVSGCSSLFAKVSLGEILNGNASRYSEAFIGELDE